MSRLSDALRELNEQIDAENRMLTAQEAAAAMTRARLQTLMRNRDECLAIAEAKGLQAIESPSGADRVLDAAERPRHLVDAGAIFGCRDPEARFTN